MDLFISYSRKNTDFVRKLHDALVAQKREVWVDWEDIPLASDWRAEIFAGIESAHNFLFVISPESVASEVCGEELAHALKNNKRLLPVLFVEADRKAMPAEVSSHNWIYFRESDDFDRALESLLQTLDTDLDYVKMHTRLLVRAREWDTKQRNPSFLLRGADLQEAEQWFLASTGKKPAATTLHHEYVDASRKAAMQRQRVIASALAVGFVIAIILAAIAVQRSIVANQDAAIAQTNAVRADNNAALAQTNEAQAQKNAAIAQTNAVRADNNAATAQSNLVRAESLRLAAAAEGVLQANGDPRLALLLAIRSLRIAFNTQGIIALQGALVPNENVIVLTGHISSVLTAVFSPDGKTILTSSFDGSAMLWDANTGRRLAVLAGHRAGLSSARFSPDGKTILTASDDQTAMLWDASSGKRLYALAGHTDRLSAAVFSPDGPYARSGTPTP